MSGIFGIHAPAGEPETRFAAMAQGMRYWQPDAAGEWCGPTAALGCLLSFNTPEARHGAQPRLGGADGRRVVLVADARLDNRAELLSRLAHRLPARAPEEIPDAELLLAAYLEWGERAPAELLGDFAFALWDEARGELFCARDHLGIKPFYYAFEDGVFRFANDLRALAGARRLDAESVARYLAEGELFHREGTFLAGVRKLPPGCSVSVGANGLSRRAYWRPEDSPPVRLPSPEAYAERLRELLHEAVGARLRTDSAVVSHLSGGLDSSVVTVIAARLLQGVAPLYSINWLHAPGPADDAGANEWALGRLVAEQEGIPHEFTGLDAGEIGRQLLKSDLAAHETVDGWYEGPVMQRARSRGARVILSGWGGDELVSYSGRRTCTGLLRQGRVLAALRGVRDGSPGGRPGLLGFAGGCRRELLRPFTQRLRGRARSPAYLDFAAPELRALAARLEPVVYDGNGLSPREEQLGILAQDHLQNRTECWANAARRHGIEYRFPLLDKRVVEFALGLPAECYRGGGLNRRVFRDAASGLVPEAVRLKRSKVDPARVLRLLELLRAGFDHWLQANENRDAAPAGAVDAAALGAAIRDLRQADNSLTAEHIRRVQAVEKSIRVVTAADRYGYNDAQI